MCFSPGVQIVAPRTSARSSSCSTTRTKRGRSSTPSSRSHAASTAAARASTSSTRPRCEGSTSSSCSPTSVSARGCTRSSARGRSRRSSRPNRRSGGGRSRGRPAPGASKRPRTAGRWSSPGARRRALIEEAAGLGRFKARRHRAELKLARVAAQVDRARDLEEEVKKRLRPLALQATAAERAEKLRGELAKLRARIAELDLLTLDERIAEAAERKTAAGLARRAAEEKLEAILAERGRAEEELADAAGKREQAMQVLYRLRSAAERLVLRRESSVALVEQVRAELADVETDAGEPSIEVDELERSALAAAEAARVAAVEREARAERARQVLARLLAAERGLGDATQAKLDELLVRRSAIESELTGAAGEREAALSVSYELRSRAARLAVQRESATRMIARLRSELADAEADAERPGPSPEQLEQQALYARAAARDAAHERDTLAERALTAQERLSTLERSLAEREGIPPAARALAAQGERLSPSLLPRGPRTGRAGRRALRG